MTQDKGQASSVESREDPGMVEVRQQHHTLAGVRWRSHSMELHHQEVLKRARLIHGQGLRVAFPSTKGNGYLEAHEAARPLHVPEEGSSPGKLFSMPH